jgi:hypothetical protein
LPSRYSTREWNGLAVSTRARLSSDCVTDADSVSLVRQRASVARPDENFRNFSAPRAPRATYDHSTGVENRHL